MNSSPVNLRNLESIQEESSSRGSRLAAVLLAGTGTAAVLLSTWILHERHPSQASASKDPLAGLVEAAQKEKAGTGVQLRPEDVDFPEVLSDADHRTTALVAVRDENGKLLPQEGEGQALPDHPPPDASALPSSPLPAGNLLSATPVATEPKDELVRIAVSASQVPSNQAPAEAGSEGDYSIQAASFKNPDDAERFVMELRKRGHHAYRQAANVPGRGLWHRVRIGPFKNKFDAENYRRKLESSERMTAILIDPEKVERAEQARAAKLAERIQKFGGE